MSPSDSRLCLPEWGLHTNVHGPERRRMRPRDLTFHLHNCKLKRIAPALDIHQKVIRSQTPWTCNYDTEMLIFQFGLLFCCLPRGLIMTEFPVWCLAIPTGRSLAWSNQILTIKGQWMQFSTSHKTGLPRMMAALLGQNSTLPGNSQGCFQEPDLEKRNARLWNKPRKDEKKEATKRGCS